MLTFTFLLSTIACFALYLKEKQAKQFVENCKRILPSADTDEDLLGVLEASGADMAPKLLQAAEHIDPAAQWRYDVGKDTPQQIAWELLLKDLELETDDKDRLFVLTEWLLRGYEMTATTSVDVLKYFTTAQHRANARELITMAILRETIER